MDGISYMPRLRGKSEEFDFENINLIGIGVASAPVSPKDARLPRTAHDMYMGIYPIQFRSSLYVDGISLNSKGVVQVATKFRDNSIPILAPEKMCIIMELNNNTVQFMELDGILDSKGLQILHDWIQKDKSLLLTIANEYEQHDRQFYHFMYDLIGLVKAISKLSPSEASQIMDNTRTAQTLLHDRVFAEVYLEYVEKGSNPQLLPIKASSSKKPDLQINGIFADVKAILITGRYKEKLLKNFDNKLTNDILEKEKEKNQIDQNGTFFIAIWSGVVSSILYTVYNEMKNDSVFKGVKIYDEIPPFEANKVIFVLPNPTAFKNHYLVMDKQRVSRIIDYIRRKCYDKIKKYDSMSYLTLINVRKGCPFGLTGQNPAIHFKLT